ncbi:hypothetical protein GGS20DRAFT_582395 [Poronia punctata]|nr:hypothetical protein GGS20DRAFT_582395 [Poronia punctata]
MVFPQEATYPNQEAWSGARQGTQAQQDPFAEEADASLNGDTGEPFSDKGRLWKMPLDLVEDPWPYEGLLAQLESVTSELQAQSHLWAALVQELVALNDCIAEHARNLMPKARAERWRIRGQKQRYLYYPSEEALAGAKADNKGLIFATAEDAIWAKLKDEERIMREGQRLQQRDLKRKERVRQQIESQVIWEQSLQVRLSLLTVALRCRERWDQAQKAQKDRRAGLQTQPPYTSTAQPGAAWSPYYPAQGNQDDVGNSHLEPQVLQPYTGIVAGMTMDTISLPYGTHWGLYPSGAPPSWQSSTPGGLEVVWEETGRDDQGQASIPRPGTVPPQNGLDPYGWSGTGRDDQGQASISRPATMPPPQHHEFPS